MKQKQQRYQRLIAQYQELCTAAEDPVSRMASAASLLYHKMGHFFWVGFYRRVDGQLLVGPYQGTLACQKLKKDTGVCWACVNQNRTFIVPDVSQFPGHIACDPRSRSEIAVPVRDRQGRVTAVLDADSDRLNAFDSVDAENLQTLASLLSGGLSAAG